MPVTIGNPARENWNSRIIGSVEGRIRKLAGFRKSHHYAPDAHHNAAQAFVRRIGQEEVKSVADRLYSDVRQLFDYKRREFDYSCEDGMAIIKTPDFELEIRIDQSPGDVRNYRLATTITRLHNPEIRQDERFHSCFTHHCDSLVVDFPEPVSIEQKIDLIEDIPEIAACLDYAPDATSFELKLPSLDLHIFVTSTQMTFRLLCLRNLTKLLNHSQKAFDILAAAGLAPRLP